MDGFFLISHRRIMANIILGEDVSSILFLGEKRHAGDNVISFALMTAPIIPIFACNRNGQQKKHIRH
tara:strand:- start:16 stop:216 length:201 start_codon:yes stop_codon:yes gene_type:complete